MGDGFVLVEGEERLASEGRLDAVSGAADDTSSRTYFCMRELAKGVS